MRAPTISGCRLCIGTEKAFNYDVQQLLEPYTSLVRLHQQDLICYQSSPEPVELLFVDAMKSWPLAEKIVSSFFPFLIPGSSVVVQQDFVFHHPIAATNHLVMWRLRDYFEWLHQVPGGGSVAFVNRRRIQTNALPDLTPESFTLADINQAYDYSLACVPEVERRQYIQGARLLFLIERGYYQAALEHARGLVEKRTKFRQDIIADSLRLVEAYQKRGLAQGTSTPNGLRSAEKSEALAGMALLLPALTA